MHSSCTCARVPGVSDQPNPRRAIDGERGNHWGVNKAPRGRIAVLYGVALALSARARQLTPQAPEGEGVRPRDVVASPFAVPRGRRPARSRTGRLGEEA